MPTIRPVGFGLDQSAHGRIVGIDAAVDQRVVVLRRVHVQLARLEESRGGAGGARHALYGEIVIGFRLGVAALEEEREPALDFVACLLYTSDAADDLLCVDLGGRRIIK